MLQVSKILLIFLQSNPASPLELFLVPFLKGFRFSSNFLTYDHIVLLFQLVLAQVILTPVKLSSSLSITSKDTIP